jgi:hypothetical protein
MTKRDEKDVNRRSGTVGASILAAAGIRIRNSCPSHAGKRMSCGLDFARRNRILTILPPNRPQHRHVCSDWTDECGDQGIRECGEDGHDT